MEEVQNVVDEVVAPVANAVMETVQAVVAPVANVVQQAVESVAEIIPTPKKKMSKSSKKSDSDLLVKGLIVGFVLVAGVWAWKSRSQNITAPTVNPNNVQPGITPDQAASVTQAPDGSMHPSYF